MLLIESPSAKKREINNLMRQRFWADQGPTPIAFFCECDDAGCYRPVWLTVAAYDVVRLDPSWVALAEGHPVGGVGQAA